MRKRGPRPEAVRRAISAKLLGRKKTEAHRAAIAEGNRRRWQRTDRRKKIKKAELKKSSDGVCIEKDRQAWQLDFRTKMSFRDWLVVERPLTASRAKFLYPDGFWVYKHIDPFDGRLLHVGISPTEEGMREYQPSVFRRNKRLRELFLFEEIPKIEVVASGLKFSDAKREQRYLVQQERNGGEADE